MHSTRIEQELVEIDALLRNKDFSYEIAKALNAAYDGADTDFTDTDKDQLPVITNITDQKIARKLAGFYALECAIGLLSEQTNTTPVDWLKKIVNRTAEVDAVLLLNRFANATWKAGQPFQSMDRIARYNFTGASFLNGEEVEKDLTQINEAASTVLEHMQEVENVSRHEQMLQLKKLLQDKDFATTIAGVNEATSNDTVGLENDVVLRKASDEKIAMNLAGFYALECGINYLATVRDLLPSDILKSIIAETIDANDKDLFLRLANATWKASQPFRHLDRITREVFVPFYFLPKEEIEKDMVQIKVASKTLLDAMLAMENKETE